jgi:hypothetical protein
VNDNLNERDGFKIFEQAKILALAELDPIEFARRKPEEAKYLGISKFDLDRLVQATRRELGKESRLQENREFKLVKACDFECRAPKWLIHGMIEVDTLGMIFGDTGSYKSFVAIDIGLSVATGISFHGKTVKQGPVVYIAGEGQNGLSRRFLAWSLARAQDYHDSSIFISIMPASFLNPESVLEVKTAIEEIKPVLIIVDTLARNYGPGDENSTSDMSRFINAVDVIRRPYNATLIIIHHTGLSEKDRSRGAYALKCALDFEYRTTKNKNNVIVLEATKMKDVEPSEPLAFMPQVINLIDEQSQPTTSLTLELTELPEKKKRSLPRTQRVALESLTRLLTNKEKVHIDDWRADCYTASISSGASDSAKRTAFSRARTELLNSRLIETSNDEYWLPSHNDTL